MHLDFDICDLAKGIATHLSGARNDKKEEARNDTPYSGANTIFLLPMGD
jgi:hypothetical protein